jgi:hypothetical protein
MNPPSVLTIFITLIGSWYCLKGAAYRFLPAIDPNMCMLTHPEFTWNIDLLTWAHPLPPMLWPALYILENAKCLDPEMAKINWHEWTGMYRAHKKFWTDSYYMKTREANLDYFHRVGPLTEDGIKHVRATNVSAEEIINGLKERYKATAPSFNIDIRDFSIICTFSSTRMEPIWLVVHNCLARNPELLWCFTRIVGEFTYWDSEDMYHIPGFIIMTFKLMEKGHFSIEQLLYLFWEAHFLLDPVLKRILIKISHAVLKVNFFSDYLNINIPFFRIELNCDTNDTKVYRSGVVSQFIIAIMELPQMYNSINACHIKSHKILSELYIDKFLINYRYNPETACNIAISNTSCSRVLNYNFDVIPSWSVLASRCWHHIMEIREYAVLPNNIIYSIKPQLQPPTMDDLIVKLEMDYVDELWTRRILAKDKRYVFVESLVDEENDVILRYYPKYLYNRFKDLQKVFITNNKVDMEFLYYKYLHEHDPLQRMKYYRNAEEFANRNRDIYLKKDRNAINLLIKKKKGWWWKLL